MIDACAVKYRSDAAATGLIRWQMDKKMDLDNLIAKAEQLARGGNPASAMSLANDLVGQYPEQMRVWSLRAYLHGRDKHYIEAVADLSRAIEINAMEPDFFLNRGVYRFMLNEERLAIEDFTAALSLCDHYNDDYYRETLHFWRAEALLRLGRKAEAMHDLSRIRDDFSFWTYALRTKGDLLADCRRLP